MSKPLIVHIITMLELGGAQQNTLYTVSHLDRRRFNVALLTGPGGILDSEARVMPDLELHFIPDLAREILPWRDALAFAEIMAVLRSLQKRHGSPLVVHTHSSKAGIVGRWAGRAAGVEAIVHSIHGFGFNDWQRWPVRKAFFAAERITAPITDHFIAVSEANAKRGIELGLFPKEKVSILRSGIPLAEFDLPAERRAQARQRIRAELGIAPDVPLIGMVACFKPQKNPGDFVRAAEIISRNLPEARFIIAGDGELRGEVESLIASKRLAGKVRLLGWRRDVADLMAAMDLLMLTSLWEGLPRVYPQAMAMGLPVVGTDVDGGREAILNGRNGFLVAPGDILSLAERATRLLADKDLAARFGREAKALVGQWDIDQMVQEQENLYLRLLG